MTMRCWKTKSNYTITQLLSGRSNAFLFQGGDLKILIDTGTRAQWGTLVQRLERLGITHLDYLILTHTHNDHAANAHKIRIKYGAAVMVHRAEVRHLTEGRPVIPQGTNFYSRTLVRVFGAWAALWLRYEPCLYDWVVDDRLDLGEIGLNAYLLHTPGHSSGSISLIVEDEIVLLGDVMIGRGIHYTYPPFADEPSVLIGSWKKLLETPCHLFIPSHGWANKRVLVEKLYQKKKKLLVREGDS